MFSAVKITKKFEKKEKTEKEKEKGKQKQNIKIENLIS